jgi:hypothetical protein
VAGLITTVVIGFTLSRTTGLPGDSADIGNWSEPIGIASLFVEGTLIALSTAVARGVLDTVTPAATRSSATRPGARGVRTLSAA